MTLTALTQAGSNIVIASGVSNSSLHILNHRLPPLGIVARFVESGNAEDVRRSINANTKAILVESLCSKSLTVADIEALAGVAHEEGVPLVV